MFIFLLSKEFEKIDENFFWNKYDDYFKISFTLNYEINKKRASDSQIKYQRLTLKAIINLECLKLLPVYW